MIEILIASLVIMLASLTGVLFVWKGVGEAVSRNLHYLVSLSAGVFLVVSFQLGREVLSSVSGMIPGALWILVGALLFWLVFKLLPTFHHHHDEQHEDEPHSTLDVRRILAGDAIHNIADGVLVATAFAISLSLGVVTAVSIFVHEVVQEVSEFFVLKQAGYSTKKALLVNLAVSSTILVGAVGSMLLLQEFAQLEIPLMGIAAGAFLVVVFQDLIPHSVREAKNRASYLKHASWFVLGAILMFGVNSVAVHSHEGDEHHEHQEHQHESHGHDHHDEVHDN